ncbi:DUF1284 domain-containing protein [soil metagenome]
MTVALRAHHLLCMLTYVGHGYSEAFVAGYDRIVQRVSAGEPIRIVDGPDEICAPLLQGEAPHCLRDGVSMRDASAARQLETLLGLPIAAGTGIELSATRLETMRQAFARSHVREACEGCQWSSLCTSIAGDGFAGVKLKVTA